MPTMAGPRVRPAAEGSGGAGPAAAGSSGAGQASLSNIWAGTSVSCRSPGLLSSGRALQETGREMSGGRMRMTILGKWGVVYRCNFAIQLLGFLGIWKSGFLNLWIPNGHEVRVEWSSARSEDSTGVRVSLGQCIQLSLCLLVHNHVWNMCKYGWSSS